MNRNRKMKEVGPSKIKRYHSDGSFRDEVKFPAVKKHEQLHMTKERATAKRKFRIKNGKKLYTENLIFG